MKNYKSNLIFLKLLLYIVLSIFLSSTTLVLINFLFTELFPYNTISYFIYDFKDITYIRYGKEIIFLLILILVAIMYLYLLTRRSINQLYSIQKNLNMMSNGKTDIKIPVTTSNEIGLLASNINNLIDRSNEALENQRKADKTKNELITNVSHDLRTPLTSILGYLNIIDNDKYRDEIELRYYVNIAHEKAKVLDVLINDLFELTKMRNDGVKLNTYNIDVVELLGQLIEFNAVSFSKHNIIGRTFFSEDKFIINGDGNKLARTFENIISNAIKYGSDSNYIDIFTSVENGFGKVVIRNYGDPIPLIDLPHVFDRFYRVEKSRTTENGGSGLGLAIAKSIIELHNGSITVESDDDATSFIIKLPLVQ